MFLSFSAVATIYRIWCDRLGTCTETVGSAFRKECIAFTKDNNRRWFYLVAALIVTQCIIIANPGKGPIIEGIKDVPSAIFSDADRKSADRHANYLLYG